MTRTPAEVGAIVAERRQSRGVRQDDIPGISSALVRLIERGTAPPGGRRLNRAAFMRAIGWPDDALEQLAGGADPADLDAAGSATASRPAGPVTREEVDALADRVATLESAIRDALDRVERAAAQEDVRSSPAGQ